tara:strand:- start:98 stop:538 length:441 start_codon:yes stop_codon:yes gene_type:complete
MGLFDKFKKEKAPSESRYSPRQKSLLDFVLQNDSYGRYMDDPNLMYPGGRGITEEQYGDSLEGENWARMEEQIGGDWYSGRINRVPADLVGGKEGEFRYYGSGGKHPYRDIAGQLVPHRARNKPFSSVSDSLTTSDALRLKALWEE